MDAEGQRASFARTTDAFADGEVVWSWCPDAGIKLAMMRRITPATVTRKPDHRLFDSHILELQSGSVFDAAEGFEA